MVSETMSITLLLLPGMDGTGDLFAPLIAHLTEDLISNVVAYPDNEATYDEHVALVRAALPTKGAYILVGESYSGPIAVAIAAEKPPRLAGIVLCASFLTCPRATLPMIKRLLRMAPPVRVPASLVIPFVLGKYATRSLRRLFSDVVKKVSPRTLRARLSNIAGVDVSAPARAITVPCLYLRALSDKLVPRTAGELVRKTIGATVVADLAGPHFLLQSNPAEAAAEIETFAKRVGAR